MEMKENREKNIEGNREAIEALANNIQKDISHLETTLNKPGSDCIQLLNDIDCLISNSSTLPLTSKAVVDAERLFELTEKFRKVFPTEIEQAQMVIRDLQDIVENAENKASYIIQEAEAKAKNILNESRILKEAQEKADKIMFEAHQGRDMLKQDAEEYVSNLFTSAEARLQETIVSIKKAKTSVQEL